MLDKPGKLQGVLCAQCFCSLHHRFDPLLLMFRLLYVWLQPKHFTGSPFFLAAEVWHTVRVVAPAHLRSEQGCPAAPFARPDIFRTGLGDPPACTGLLTAATLGGGRAGHAGSHGVH